MLSLLVGLLLYFMVDVLVCLCVVGLNVALSSVAVFVLLDVCCFLCVVVADLVVAFVFVWLLHKFVLVLY